MSSNNIRSSKYQKTNSTNMLHGAGAKSLLQAQGRLRSVTGQKNQQSSALEKLQVGQQRSKEVVDYSQMFSCTSESYDTKQLLEKYVTEHENHKLPQNKKNHQRKGSQVRVIAKSESQNERIKLVVVENTFGQVIQAMCKNY